MHEPVPAMFVEKVKKWIDFDIKNDYILYTIMQSEENLTGNKFTCDYLLRDIYSHTASVP